MRRFGGLVAAAAFVCAVLTASGAPAHHRIVMVHSHALVDCYSDAQLYKYCGVHWDDAKLPITVVGLPSWATPIRAALETWESASPGSEKACPLGGGTAKVFCYASSGTNAVGRTALTFWNPPSPRPCTGGPTNWIALTCSAAPDSNRHIVDADVWFNGTKPWAHLAADLNSDMRGLFGNSPARCTYFPPCPTQYDLQSVLTHELGHVLGLGDLYGVPGFYVGEGCPGFVDDLSAGVNYRQTMYGCFVVGTTDRRSLDEGDLAGIERIFFDTYSPFD